MSKKSFSEQISPNTSDLNQGLNVGQNPEDFVSRLGDNVKITMLPNGRLRVDHMNYEKSLTQQCFADGADVNKIMARWLNGGPPPVSADVRAVFRDVSSGMDYREILDRVMETQESFDSLPADMRDRFKNDPALLLDFVSDPANESECIKLGLLEGELPPVEKPAEAPNNAST